MIRPLSPHLKIYKFPIAAISSITNRVSGMYITIIYLGGAFFSLSDENNKNKFFSYYNNLSIYNKKIFNCTLLYPFGYHFTGGIRHLIWDAFPHLLTNSKVASSSKLLFIASILPTLLLENKLKNKFN